MYLLDTNICIYLMKATYPALTNRIFNISPEKIAVSSVTLFEIEYGAVESKWGEKNLIKLHTFLSPFSIINFGIEDAQNAGHIRAFLVEEGKPIGPYDLMIASQAYTRDMTLVTHNIKEFSHVPGLRAEDWTQLS